MCEGLNLDYNHIALSEQGYCGCGNNDYKDFGKANELECNNLCRDNDREFCGGNEKISVYRVFKKCHSSCALD